VKDQVRVGSKAVEELPAYQVARRQKIIDAAWGLLEQQEFEQIQIRDVAAAAGIAPATLYRYFSSKEHLYAVVLLNWGVGHSRSTGARPVPDDDPLVRLRRRIRTALVAFEKRPRFYRALALLLGTADPNANAAMRDLRAELEGAVATDLAALGPDGADDVTVMVWAVVNSLMTRSAFQDYPMFDAYRVLDRFLDMLALHYRTQVDQGPSPSIT
jgi:AcrR family transcriptional regulator